MNLHLKENWGKVTEKTERIRLQTNSKVKKTIIATLVISTISVNSALATTNEAPKLQTIYHVYIENRYLGTVSDKEKVEELISKRIQEVKDQYQGFQLNFTAEDLTFVPEQTFNKTSVTDNEIYRYINSDFSITVEAVALLIDGTTITFLENNEKVEEVIQFLKKKYIPEEQLNQLETQNSSDETLPPLENGQSRIINVDFSKSISTSIEEVTPDQLLAVDDVVNLLEKGTLEEKKYIVKEGDVLGSIAEKHGLKLKQLLELNPTLTEDSLLHIGDEVVVTAYEPFLEVLTEKETATTEPIGYSTEIVDDDTMYKGETTIVQEGSTGEKNVIYQISEQNGQEISRTVVSETITKEPTKQIIHKGTKVIPSRGTGTFIWPTNGGYISSEVGYRWGKQHKGIDIARPTDRSIKAVDNGVVTFAGWDGGYGNKIVINHNNGMETIYGHLASINVSVGDTVVQGKEIGVMGSTGNSTGIHLHFEVYQNGILQNPLDYLR